MSSPERMAECQRRLRAYRREHGLCYRCGSSQDDQYRTCSLCRDTINEQRGAPGATRREMTLSDYRVYTTRVNNARANTRGR